MKCDIYWPEINVTAQYDDISVTCNSEDVYANNTVRSFTVEQVNGFITTPDWVVHLSLNINVSHNSFLNPNQAF